MRVNRSFAFVDLCGFTSLTDVHGDQLAVDTLARFRAVLREIASRRGVRIAKWLGDGAMIVAVDVEPLVAAVLEIESHLDAAGSELALRAGMASGEVILFEGDDHIGRTVNLAARLGDAAGPHEILVTPEVAEHRPPWTVATPRPGLRVPGFAHPIDAFDLSVCDHRDGTVVDPVCGMQLPADRTSELRRDGGGATVHFCSADCAEIWEQQRV